MAEQDLSVITNQLSKVTTEESTVKISYAGQANKWNNADDGKLSDIGVVKMFTVLQCSFRSQCLDLGDVLSLFL